MSCLVRQTNASGPLATLRRASSFALLSGRYNSMSTGKCEVRAAAVRLDGDLAVGDRAGRAGVHARTARASTVIFYDR
jgi:hypothetical protein